MSSTGSREPAGESMYLAPSALSLRPQMVQKASQLVSVARQHVGKLDIA
jgi:hypothetical protein